MAKAEKLQTKKVSRVIGLEIDSSEIRAVELNGTASSFDVTTFGRVSLPIGIMEEGFIKNFDALLAIVRTFFKDTHFSSKNVVIGVKNHNIVLRMAQLPKLSLEKRRQAALFQAQQYIPIPTSELIMDVVFGGDVQVDGKEYVNALFVGAKRNFLTPMIDICDKMGLKILCIDSSLLAVSQPIVKNEGVDKTFMLAFMDKEVLSMNIIKDGVISMTRTIVLPDEALEILSRNKDHINAEDTLALADILKTDLSASLNFFFSQNNETVPHVYCLSPLPYLSSLLRVLSDGLDCPVEIPSLYPNLSKLNPLEYGACISLALRGLE